MAKKSLQTRKKNKYKRLAKKETIKGKGFIKTLFSRKKKPKIVKIKELTPIDEQLKRYLSHKIVQKTPQPAHVTIEDIMKTL